MKRSNSGSFVQLNAVVRLKNGFTGNSISEGVTFELDGVSCAPVMKADGFFVFPNYVDASLPHILSISASGFIGVVAPLLPVEPPLAEAVQVFTMQPSPSYDYPT